MSNLKIHDKIQEVLDKLFFCTTKEDIEKVFNDNSIVDYKEKIELIRRCMKVVEVFDLPSNKTTLEDEYNYEIKIFLGNYWRLLQ